MKKFRFLFTTAFFVGLVFFALAQQTLAPGFAIAAELPLSSKGWQSTVVKIEGVNTSKALAVGEVRRPNAAEYCERDPGGMTKKYGGKLTKEQCIERVLREEKGKLYSASADCPRKTILTEFGSFTLIGIDYSAGFPDFKWRDNQNGKVLDGSSASGNVVELSRTA
jgi:hypothetical protein